MIDAIVLEALRDGRHGRRAGATGSSLEAVRDPPDLVDVATAQGFGDRLGSLGQFDIEQRQQFVEPLLSDRRP